MKTLFYLTLITCLIAAVHISAVTFDGANITGDFAQATITTFQDTMSNWGDQRFLASMYAMTNDSAVLLGIGLELDWESFTLFFDVDPTAGSQVYPNYTGQLDGEARAAFSNMTFDTNFTPDRAITFTRWQNLQPDEGCHIGWHDINQQVSTSWGKYENTQNPYVFTNETVIFAFESANDVGDTNRVHEWTQGCELYIPFEWLGATTNAIKIMAQINGWAGDWVANQTLPPVHNDPATTNSVTAERRYDLITGLQYMSIPVKQTGTGGVLFVTASQSQTRLFAESSINELDAAANGGIPPYTFRWETGDGFITNAESFIYTYPVDGVFTTRIIVSDDAGQTVTNILGDVNVMPATHVDGLAIPTDFADKGTSVVQDTASNWGEATIPGNGAELDQLHAYSENDKLYIGVCGNVTTGTSERVLCVLIDCSSAVGTNVMPAVTSGSPAKLESLQDMTFDTAFTPDKAILFSVGQPYDYWVNYYEIDINSDTWWGDKTEWHSIFDPYQRSYILISNEIAGIAAFNDLNIEANPADATTGFEAMLGYDLVYNSISISNQESKIRLQAILYDYGTGFLANQSLPGINGNTTGYGAAPAVDFSAVPGDQFIEIDAPIIPEPISIGVFFALIAVFLCRKK